MIRKALFILYVEDQNRSRDFYQTVLDREPILDVPGMTEFELTENSVLGLMRAEGMAKILGSGAPDPREGQGIPRCELYLLVADPAVCHGRLIQAGGKEISPPKKRDWGDLVAYGLDPDGHVVAFACPQ